MKKHPLFRRIAVSYRFPKWIVDAIDEASELTDTDKTDVVQQGIMKSLKLKKPDLRKMDK